MNKIGQALKANSKRRNPFTNFVLYAVQLASGVAIIALVPEVLWSIGLLDDPDWTLTAVYGKGVIPAFLALISGFISNLLIFRWQKKGLTIMLISFFVICLPLIKEEYMIFVVFLGFMYGGLLIYWLMLLLKRNGVSTWEQCEGDYKLANSTILLAAIFLMGLMPPVTGYAVGFKDGLYGKGCDCLNAHLNSWCFYKYQFGRDLAFSSYREENSTKTHIRSCRAMWWFQLALQSAKEEKWLLESVYSSYICLLIEDDDIRSARVQYKEALQYIAKNKLRETIAEDDMLKYYLDEFDYFVENYENTEAAKQ